MSTSLAIDDALIQAKVPPDAAKAVVAALETDMTTWLATQQDLRHATEPLTARIITLEGRMDQKFEAVGQRFITSETRMDQRFAAVDQKFEVLESRLVIKLGALMGVMFGIAGALAGLLR